MGDKKSNSQPGELEIDGVVSGWRKSDCELSALSLEVNALFIEKGLGLAGTGFSGNLSGEERIDRPFFPERVWFSFCADGVREDSPSVSSVVAHIMSFFESHQAKIIEITFVSNPVPVLSARAPWTSAVQSDA